MVGTIRRPVQEVNTAGTPPPPSYQAATSPTTAGASGGGQNHSINAGAFQRNPSSSSSGSNVPASRHSVAVAGGGYGQPLPQVPSQQRPMSYAQPGGAPPARQQQQYQQPPGPPPPSQQLPQPGSSTAPQRGGSLHRSNTQEDRLAVCEFWV